MICPFAKLAIKVCMCMCWYFWVCGYVCLYKDVRPVNICCCRWLDGEKGGNKIKTPKTNQPITKTATKKKNQRKTTTKTNEPKNSTNKPIKSLWRCSASCSIWSFSCWFSICCHFGVSSTGTRFCKSVQKECVSTDPDNFIRKQGFVNLNSLLIQIFQSRYSLPRFSGI